MNSHQRRKARRKAGWYSGIPTAQLNEDALRDMARWSVEWLSHGGFRLIPPGLGTKKPASG